MLRFRVLLFLLLFASNFIAQTKDADIILLKQHLKSFILSDEFKVEDFTISDFEVKNDVKILLEKLADNGSWSDIDYSESAHARWMPALHWKRILKLSELLNDKRSLYYGDTALIRKTLDAIEFWTITKPVSPNYWWNAVGVPLYMGPACLLLEDKIPAPLKQKIISLLNIGVKPTNYDFNGKTATGQNLLWLANAHLYSSLLTNDRQGLDRVFSSVSDEIKVTDKEGIQPDYSFHQHGSQLYSFGYGKAFIMRAASYVYIAKATAWEFPKEKEEILGNLLLEGQQWMSRNLFFDYNAKGREITRENFTVYPLELACKMLGKVDKSRESAYRTFLHQLMNGVRAKPLIGNRNFYRSDFMVHQRSNYYFSIKGTSIHTIGSESGNGENQKGYYLGKGNTFLVRRGDEYRDIFPVWNWRKLPGTIIEQSNEPLPLFDWGRGNTGKTSFVYGVSDGMYGCFGYDYELENIKAKRAWFMFDKEIVCMVAGLTNGDNDFFQTINQCLLHDEVMLDKQILNSETQLNKSAKWVLHDSIAYYTKNLKSNLQIQNHIQTGSWKSIDTNGRDDTIQKKVFTLGMKIGKHEKNKSYYYAILPGVGTNDLKNYCFENNIKILRNDSTVQAVYNKKLEQVQAVFYHPNQIQLPWKKLKLEVFKPSLIIIKKVQYKLEIQLSQPPLNSQFSVDISKKFNFKNDNLILTD